MCELLLSGEMKSNGQSWWKGNRTVTLLGPREAAKEKHS